jgi:undecaprenyl-diphosphatase
VDSFKAFVLGVVQGLTEFLPISSSGHLTLVPWLFNWPPPSLAFEAALHLGTLVAVILYFRVEIMRMLQAIPLALTNIPSLLRNEPVADARAPDARLGLLIVIGSIPGGIAGLALNSWIDDFFHSSSHQDRAVLAIAAFLALFAILLFLAERVGRQTRTVRDLNLMDALLIGVAQAIALFPGTSRSGVTMTTGLGRDVNRVDAARFSFLLGLPLVLLAGLTGLKDIFDAGTSEIGTGSLLIGIATSAVTGVGTIWALLRLLQRMPTTMFVVYRLIAAAFVVILVATGVR